jgi:hypothetical protein
MAIPASTVPDAPRTETREYHFPPARPDPRVADCDRERLLDIAAEGARCAYDLCSSTAHVEAICHDYVQVASALELAQEREAVVRRKFDELRALHTEMILHVAMLEGKAATAETMRCAALEEVVRLTALAARLSSENATLRLARGHDAILRTAYVARLTTMLFDLSDADTEVVDVPHGGVR